MKKDYKISFIRSLAFASIISCHILQGLGNPAAFWVNVGVQVFFFISGFLYGQKKIEDPKIFYKKRLLKILLPTSLLVFLVFIIEGLILRARSYNIFSLVGSLVGLGGFSAMASPILSNLWFVSYILLCYLMLPFLQQIFIKNGEFKRNVKILIILMGIIQILSSYHVISINPAWINNFIVAYFFGRYSNDEKRANVMSISFLILTLAMLPLAIILQEKLNIWLPGQIQKHAYFFIDYGHVLLGCSIFIVLYRLLPKINRPWIAKILDLIDSYSFFIYLVHQIFILGGASLLFITKNSFINVTVILIASIISGYLLKLLTGLVFRLAEKLIKNLPIKNPQ